MPINKFRSNTIPQLFDVVKKNNHVYSAIKNYIGNDYQQKVTSCHPFDSMVKLGTINHFDINLCILNPHTFYYNKVPTYIRVLKGAAYVQLEVEHKINPGFMISEDMSLKLCHPHTLSNTNMGTNILLTINKTVNSNELPLL
jgi:hypothetical protein